MMNQDSIFKKIGFILNELQDQYEYLERKKSNINEVEIDFLMANIAFLNENAQVLKKIYQPTDEEQDFKEESILEQKLETEQVENLEQEAAEEQIEKEENFVFELEAKGLSFILENEEVTDQFDYEIKPVTELFDRPLKEEEALLLKKIEEKNNEEFQIEEEEEEEEEEEFAPAPFLLVKEEKQVEVNQAQESLVTTLNDLLQNRKEINRINEIQNEVVDLKSAINLNDKLLYIRELFNGYNLAYAEAIELLSKMPNYEAADVFLQKNYAVKNNWEDKQDTVNQFYNLLKRYFKTN